MKRKLLLIPLMLVITASLVVGCAPAAPTPTTPAEVEVIHWKVQSSWIRGPGLHESAEYWAEMVNKLCKGRLVIDKMYAAGELVGAFEAIPAVAEGKLDATHSSGLYLSGKLPASSLFVTAAAIPITSPVEFSVYNWYGGGNELYTEYLQTVFPKLIVFSAMLAETEQVWSTRPIRCIDDFKGLKIRSTGLGMKFFEKLGCSAVTMPMGEVIPALEKGVLDACEFSMPWTDYPVGVHKVCPYALGSGFMHIPWGHMEVYINLDSWNALPDDLKEDIKLATLMDEYWTLGYVMHINMQNAAKMEAEGAIITPVTEEMQARFDEIAAEMAEDFAKEDPWAKRVLDAQREFHERYKHYREYWEPSVDALR